MQTVKLDLMIGLVTVSSSPITIDKHNLLNKAIVKLCAPPVEKNGHTKTYSVLEKTVICGKSAECKIKECDGTVTSIIFLFDFIEFFESSVLESKILKSCEKSSDVKFKSDHPTTAYLNRDWGQAIFFYDARQGDLSLNIILDNKIISPI